MPTYVYACDTCGAQFEQFQSFKDDPIRDCPRGHVGSVRRVFQPVGIVFKGSGWYITDSRNSSSATVSKEETPAKAETKSEAPASGESTPAAAPASTASSASTTPTTSSE